ncbi:hypothetical protein B0H12DRAFT_1246993 [Mycena haematopus]|nr:hypothetical protein B0H12DRAFT_1246993 [Mycena haematopus]
MRWHCPTQRQDSPKLGLQQNRLSYRVFPITSSKRLGANRENASATSDTVSKLTQIGLAVNSLPIASSKRLGANRESASATRLYYKGFPIASLKRLGANRKNASATSDTASRVTQIGLAVNLAASCPRAEPLLALPPAQTRRSLTCAHPHLPPAARYTPWPLSATLPSRCTLHPPAAAPPAALAAPIRLPLDCPLTPLPPPLAARFTRTRFTRTHCTHCTRCTLRTPAPRCRILSPYLTALPPL